MRLIDADALVEEIKQRNPDNVSYEDAWAITCIEHAPTVKERNGEWIRWYETKEDETGTEYIPHCRCSKCGTEYDPHSSKFVSFCYVCGAKMEEGETE